MGECRWGSWGLRGATFSFLKSRAVGDAFTVLFVSCTFHFSFCVAWRAASCSRLCDDSGYPHVPSLTTSPPSQSLPLRTKVCATRWILRGKKCTGRQDLRLASSCARLYTCILFSFIFCLLSVPPALSGTTPLGWHALAFLFTVLEGAAWRLLVYGVQLLLTTNQGRSGREVLSARRLSDHATPLNSCGVPVIVRDVQETSVAVTRVIRCLGSRNCSCFCFFFSTPV